MGSDQPSKKHGRGVLDSAEAKALYAGGKTQQQIAVMLGISERQVRTFLKS
jgi:DNA-binding transcriptional regulator LsrR (DeoR family)